MNCDGSRKQIASLEQCLLGKSPQLALLQSLMQDVQPSMLMPLINCQSRFKLMCTGPTDYAKVYDYLRQAAIFRHKTAGTDCTIFTADYWTRGRVVPVGNDIREPFQLICTTNCPRALVDAEPDLKYPVFPANSGIPYGTLKPINDFRKWAFGNSKDDESFCPVK